jgi:hypothetical protein
VRAWFDTTHDVEVVGLGGVTCRCVRLPAAGAVGDQEAWLWEALGVLRDETNAILRDEVAARG